jgi:tetratricopeptide (TPR) repeat protein
MKQGWLPPTALAVLFLAIGPALGSDPLGTVGRFRSFGVSNCGAPVMSQLQGACDPPPVSETLKGAAAAQAHLDRARALVSFLRLEQAYDAAAQAVAADPRNSDALLFRARLAMSQINADASSRDLNAGLLAAPDNPFLLASRAEFLLESGDAQAAWKDISAALVQRPDDVDMLWVRARTRMELNQLGDAKKDLDRAQELEPGVRQVLLFRAQLQLRRGEFEAAVADASTVLDRQHDISAMETRAIAYVALGRNAEAVDDLSAVLGKPGEPSAASPSMPHISQLMMQRALLLVQLHRKADANLDLDAIVTAGGKRSLLRMQIYLRRNGFSDLPLDGERTAAFDSALEACFINQACGRGLVRSL